MDLQKFQKAYEIINVKENNFEFTTNFLVTYKVYVLPGKEILPNFIFAQHTWYIGFFKMPLTVPFGDKSYKGDKKVLPTIMNFILDILQTKTNIVAFNFSPQGGLGEAREKLFGDLFERYSNKQLHQMNFQLEGEDKCRIIFRCDNPNFADICTVTSKQIIKNFQDKDI